MLHPQALEQLRGKQDQQEHEEMPTGVGQAKSKLLCIYNSHEPAAPGTEQCGAARLPPSPAGAADQHMHMPF